MDSNHPIPVPWGNRVRHWTTRYFQSALFILSVAAAAYLWHRQPTGIMLTGKVESDRIVVSAPRDGMLSYISTAPKRLDVVQRGLTPLARFEIAEAVAEMETLTTERARLEAELAAERERIRRTRVEWRWSVQQHREQMKRAAIDELRLRDAAKQRVDTLRAELGDYQQRKRQWDVDRRQNTGNIAKTRLEVEVLEAQRARAKRLIDLNLSPATRLSDLDDQLKLRGGDLATLDRLQHELDRHCETLDAQVRIAMKRLLDAESDLASFEPFVTASRPAETSEPALDLNESALLEPFIQAIAVHDAKIRELAGQIASNEVVSPADGQIVDVHRSPGTYVRNGDPLVTIASTSPSWIVAYLDRSDQIPKLANQQVEIRVPGANTLIAKSEITEIGEQFETVPTVLRRNQQQTQWGVPIKIAIPSTLSVLPGQTVQLLIR